MTLKISIIVPVYNDATGLNDTLDSLVAQDFDHDQFEIIVADNGSTDTTQQVANSYVNRFPGLVTLVVEGQNQSSYAARNKGIEAASAPILSFIDADMTVKSDWLARVYQAMQDEDPDYMGCNVRIYAVEKSVPSMHNILTGFPVRNYMRNAQYAPTCCLTVKKSVIDRVGPFDSRLKSGGDREFGNRAWDSGAKFHFAHNIFMYHPARGTLKALLKKAMRIGRYGRGDMSSLFPDKYPHHKIYLTWARYLPRKPWKTRKRFRCGYSFKLSTILILTMIPVLSHYVSLAGFLRTKLKYFMERKFNSGPTASPPQAPNSDE